MEKILTTIIIIAAVAGCSRCTNNYDCGSDRCITGRFIESVSMFDSINHTGEFEFPEPANVPVDLDAESRRCVDSLGTDMGIVMSIRTSCDMMKAYVHLKGMALRAVAPEETVEALDRFEASFDTLFHRCISQEYYLRLFHDCFNETIPDALDSLVASCRKFVLKEPGSPNDGAVRLRRSSLDKKFSAINRTYHKLLNVCVPDDKSGRIEYEKMVRFRLSHLTDSIEK